MFEQVRNPFRSLSHSSSGGKRRARRNSSSPTKEEIPPEALRRKSALVPYTEEEPMQHGVPLRRSASAAISRTPSSVSIASSDSSSAAVHLSNSNELHAEHWVCDGVEV